MYTSKILSRYPYSNRAFSEATRFVILPPPIIARGSDLYHSTKGIQLKHNASSIHQPLPQNTKDSVIQNNYSMIIKQSHRYGGKSFVAVIALIASSALPVKSDAFTIIRGGANRITTKPALFPEAPAAHSPVKKVVLVPSLEEEKRSTALYAEVVAPNDYGVNLPNLDGLIAYLNKARSFVSKNFFLVGMIVAVSFARLLPKLGKNGSTVRPELFIGKYGVTTIFLLSGLSIKLKELANAAVNLKLNSLIQTITFGVWPFLVGLPLTKGIDFLFPGFLPAPLLDGLLILTCLPTTLNMCILLTAKAEGSGK